MFKQRRRSRSDTFSADGAAAAVAAAAAVGLRFKTSRRCDQCAQAQPAQESSGESPRCVCTCARVCVCNPQVMLR